MAVHHHTHKYTPRFFEWKKYILVAVCFIDIFILIAYAALSGVMADELLQHITESMQINKTETARTIVIAVTVVMCVASIFFEFVGIIGALLEHFTLVVIYLVGSAVEFVIRLVYSVYDVEYSGLLAWELVSCIVTLVYVYDLNKIRRKQNSR